VNGNVLTYLHDSSHVHDYHLLVVNAMARHAAVVDLVEAGICGILRMPR
jgi:hypothetical protein